MSCSKKTSRRQFLGQGAALASTGLALPYLVPRNVLGGNGQPTPNEQIGIGRIGNGRRAAQHPVTIDGLARVVAVADVNRNRWGKDAKYHNVFGPNGVFDNVDGKSCYQDYRRLLDRKDIDAVDIQTPEFWHYLPAIHACQAGKDVYGEQPLAGTIREGRKIVEAVRKYNRVYQVGEQQRSHPASRKGCELILNGRIGKVHTVLGVNFASPFYCDLPAQPIPEGLDWNTWCGPTEPAAYNQDLYMARANPGWMSFYPYSGGELVNWGCHAFSMVMWGLGVSDTGPVEIWVEPEGKKIQPPLYKEPESRARGDAACSQTTIHYRFANGVVLKLSESPTSVLGGGIMSGGMFIGDRGKISVLRGRYVCDPEGLDEEPLGDTAIRLPVSSDKDPDADGIQAHFRNFYECVKTRNRPTMDVEYGHRVATLCHLGNIARWLGRKLQWDPEKETFPGDEEANKYLDRPKRKPYELPDQV